jgi:hypothetical protein
MQEETFLVFSLFTMLISCALTSGRIFALVKVIKLILGGGSSSKDRVWKGKAGSSSGTKRDQRRSSLSPSRLSSEGGSKRPRKSKNCHPKLFIKGLIVTLAINK